MVLVENWYPPSRQNWALIVQTFKYFPLVTLLQWVISWYGAGKTSVKSRFNIPGKVAWLTMEAPGFLTLLYCVYTLPTELELTNLPWENYVLAALFTIHYIYRAILCPYLAPSMSPIHVIVWFFALVFQIVNGLSLGGWLGGYGPITRLDWQPDVDYKVAGRMELGMMIFFLGFAGNIFHDDELREIRRAAIKNQKKRAETADPSTGKNKEKSGNGSEKVYVIPQNGLFRWIFYPHYLLEWVEWTGFWIMAGLGCVPARTFVLNEITTMLPRALQGKQWYMARFGKEKVAGRKAIIPGIL